MIVIFSDIDGTITRVVNEEHWVQSDRNAHDIDVIFNQGFDNTEYNGYIQFQREGESKPSPKLIMTPKIITYGEGTFRGYSFRVQTEWHTAIAGTLKATIEIKQYEDTGLETNKAFGIVNIPIEEALSDNPEVESTITNEEYLALINAINAKLNIDDEKVYLFSTQYETLHAFASSCISYKNSSGKTRIYLGLVNGSAVIGVVGSGSSVMMYNGDGNVYCSNGSSYLDISITKLNLNDATSTNHTLKGSTSVEGSIDMQDADVHVKRPTTAKNPVNLEFYNTARVELIGYVDYQITQALSRIFGDSPENFPAGDTLKELYDLIINNKSLIDTIEDAVVKSVKDSNTTEINQILYRSYDYTYDAANITKVMLAVPADVSQGYLSGFSIKIGTSKPTIEFINASSLPLLFTLNGMQRRQEQLFFKPNQTLVGALMCDGINVYMYLKELQNLDQLE